MRFDSPEGVLVLFVLVVGVFMVGGMTGLQVSADYIQKTCEDPEAPTKINGHTYMCVTKEQWNEVAERIFRMGFADGVRSERRST